jgi:NAD-reducing hydrogenase small subunit
MSFLDLDEWLVELAGLVEVVYSPIVDRKEYPEHVDVCLIEGAVANEDNLEQARLIRARTRVLVSFGDCAVTGNVTAMRNPLRTAAPVIERAYLDPTNLRPRIPRAPGILPPLLDRVLPLHEVVPVDHYLPGCPPSADRIRALLQAVVNGKAPHLAGQSIRFG